DERIGEDQDLAAVGRVGERLDVAGHGGVENYLATNRSRRPERAAGHLGAVLQQQLHCYRGVHARTSDRAKQRKWVAAVRENRSVAKNLDAVNNSRSSK